MDIGPIFAIVAVNVHWACAGHLVGVVRGQPATRRSDDGRDQSNEQEQNCEQNQPDRHGSHDRCPGRFDGSENRKL